MSKGKQPKKKLNPDWPYEEMSDVVADRICWPAGPDLVKAGLKFFQEKHFQSMTKPSHIEIFEVKQNRHYLGTNEHEDVDLVVYNSSTLAEAIEKAQKFVDDLRANKINWR